MIIVVYKEKQQNRKNRTTLEKVKFEFQNPSGKQNKIWNSKQRNKILVWKFTSAKYDTIKRLVKGSSLLGEL